MKNKLTISIIAVVLLIAVSLFAAWWMAKSKNQTGSNQQNGIAPAAVETPLFNNYFLGVVTKVEGSLVYLKYDAKDREVEVSSKTEIVKQVPDPVKLVKLAPVTLKDIKVGDEVVVYFSSGPPLSENFKATKLQIL